MLTHALTVGAVYVTVHTAGAVALIIAFRHSWHASAHHRSPSSR